MKVRFTNHAQVGMSERGISNDRVIETIRWPDSSYSVRDEAMASEKLFGDKRLRVVFLERTRGEYVIITAYYL